eukprot:g860.t1
MSSSSSSTSSSFLSSLLDRTIPFWLRHGVDVAHGGFICGLSHAGDVVDDSKFTWYQGRGAWVFARVYGLTGDASHLAVASRALAFAERHCCCDPPGGTSFYTVVGRDGSALPSRTARDDVGYGSLFVAEAAQEIARHSSEAAEARRLLSRCLQLLRAFVSRADDPQRDAPEDYLLSAPYRRGTRTLGHSMIPLRLVTQLLRNFTDAELDEAGAGSSASSFLRALSDRLLSNIMDRHYDPSVGLAREELSHDFAPLRSPVLYYLGHAIECLWFVMDEAARRGDGDLLERAAARVRRHVECAWDPVYGGLVRGITLEDDHNDKIMADKVAWVQQEALVALRMVSVMSSDEALRGWAARFYARLHEWTEARFRLPLARRGYDLWMVGGDRRATFQEQYSFGGAGLTSRKENYHHPRYLMRMVMVERGELGGVGRGGEEEEVEEGGGGGVGGGGDVEGGGGGGS